ATCHTPLSVISLHDALPISSRSGHRDTPRFEEETLQPNPRDKMQFTGRSRLPSTPAGVPFRAKLSQSASSYASQPSRSRPVQPRSEEHTSELQSRENLVCRL